jgi:hypothetical protein
MNLIKLPKKFKCFGTLRCPSQTLCPMILVMVHMNTWHLCAKISNLWKNKFYMISIAQSWDTKFMIPIKVFNVKMDEAHTNEWNCIILKNEMTQDQ